MMSVTDRYDGISYVGSAGVETHFGEDVHGHEFLQELLGRVGDLHLVDLGVRLFLNKPTLTPFEMQ